MEYDLTYISFGAGVQSTAMLMMADRGQYNIKRPSVAIFSDTGDEPPWVYECVETMKRLVSIPIETVSLGISLSDTIRNDVKNRKQFLAIPAFTLGTDGRATVLRRQCTREFKIEVVNQRVKRIMGYAKGKHVKKHALVMIGITTEEAHRMTQSRVKWITNSYPLIDARISRHDCEVYLRNEGLNIKKSSCVFCPYHGNEFWKDLRDNHAEQWDEAVRFDIDLRNTTQAGDKAPAYLHRTLMPLSEVDLGDNQPDLFGDECSGMCGV